MKKSAAFALASVIVAASASMASVASARSPMYPGDHLFDYDPINQAYEWQINGDYGPTAGAAAYASTRHPSETARMVAPVAPRTFGQDPWSRARQDDSLEVGGGGG